MKYLSKEIIKNKRVLLRCDFNVPVKDNIITDDSRITKSFKTINYLLDNNNKVILLSHFGRVKKEEDKVNNSLYIVYEYLKKYYDIEFIKDPNDLSNIDGCDKKIFLVENTRFTDVPEKRESVNDLNLAKYWSNYADVFVIDAFGSLHRIHTSTAGLSKYLDTYLGFLVEDEIKNLKPLLNNIDLVIMGGAKADDKIKIIERLINKCHYLIITGGILNTFLKVMGYNIGNSLVSNDEEVLSKVEELLNKYQDKILYSDKFIAKRDNDNIIVSLKEIKDNDIIYDNIIELDNIINNSKVIFLNGTCGMCESDDYKEGTIKLLNTLASSHNDVYVGGGDTASFVKLFGLESKFKFVSSGGGATLEYISDGNLEALKYIEENSIN